MHILEHSIALYVVFCHPQQITITNEPVRTPNNTITFSFVSHNKELENPIFKWMHEGPQQRELLLVGLWMHLQ